LAVGFFRLFQQALPNLKSRFYDYNPLIVSKLFIWQLEVLQRIASRSHQAKAKQ